MHWLKLRKRNEMIEAEEQSCATSTLFQGMSERKRANSLRTKEIEIVEPLPWPNKYPVFHRQSINGAMQSVAKQIGEENKAFGFYEKVGNCGLSGHFSANNLRESYGVSTEIAVFPYVAEKASQLIRTAVEIRVRKNYKPDPNIKLWHELIAVLKIGQRFYVIHILLKEMLREENVVYIVANKGCVYKKGPESFRTQKPATINLAKIARKVKGPLVEAFPSSLLSFWQKCAKKAILKKRKKRNRPIKSSDS